MSEHFYIIIVLVIVVIFVLALIFGLEGKNFKAKFGKDKVEIEVNNENKNVK